MYGAEKQQPLAEFVMHESTSNGKRERERERASCDCCRIEKETKRPIERDGENEKHIYTYRKNAGTFRNDKSRSFFTFHVRNIQWR